MTKGVSRQRKENNRTEKKRIKKKKNKLATAGLHAPGRAGYAPPNPIIAHHVSSASLPPASYS